MLPTFADAATFYDWMNERARVLAVESEDCSLGDLEPDWLTDRESVRRPDGSFFMVRGRRVRATVGRNVRSWKQPMIVQPGGWVAGVLDQHANMLVRLLGESGSIGFLAGGLVNTRVLVAPALQFSLGQRELHRRAKRWELGRDNQPIKPIPLIEIIEDDRFPITWEKSPEDPGRFFEKVNDVGLVSVPDQATLEPDFAALDEDARQDFAWVTLPLLRQIRKDGLVNSHLRSLLSMLA